MDRKKVMAALSAIEKKKERQRKRIQSAQAQLARLEEEEEGWKRRVLAGAARKFKMEVGGRRSLLGDLQNGTDERTQEIIQEFIEDAACTVDAEEQSETGADVGTAIVKITIRVTEQEKDCIERNVLLTHCKSLNDYCRKMLVDGYVIEWDTSGLDGLLKEIGYTNRSLNQIAKRINLLNSVYQGDMFDILSSWRTLRKDMLTSLKTLRKINYVQQLKKPKPEKQEGK